MSSSPNDAELLDAGDVGALVERYRGALVRFVETMIGDAAAAEDLVQEASRVAFEKFGQFERRGKFSTWLYSIALNLARNHRRDRARRAKPAELSDEPSPLRGALSSIVRRETAEQIALALDRLPPSLREAFALHYIEGLDYGEIESITGVKARTLHVRAHRARGLMRAQLGPVVDTVWQIQK
jgi:RNA polymerase sigma-70 factor (ECF subfamily)